MALNPVTSSRSRRRFIGEAACSTLGSASVMSTLLNLGMANRAAAAGLSPGSDCRTLVCIFLHGGIDSFNVLVPRDVTRHDEYAAARTNLALDRNDLIPLNQAPGGDGQLYGVHPGMTEIAELFNGLGGDNAKRRLAFVSNVGTLIEPTTIAQYQNELVSLPKALFSHIDQIEQWQTSVPQGGTNLTGWAGRAADVLHSSLNQDLTSMSVSFAGNNVLQVGDTTQQFVMTPDGALTFSGNSAGSSHPLSLKNAALKSLMEEEYANLIERGFAELTKGSVEQQEFVQQLFDGFDEESVTTSFPGSNIGEQLYAATKMIALRPQLGLRRQTLFVSFGGWDHHGDLLENQDGMLRALSPAIGAFQGALEELGLQDEVITFTASDFGRTLRSNGRGTDHAWGGNQLVFGGPVDGGRVCGTFPSLALNGPNDIGRGGRMLPGVSVDEHFAELLRWFGVNGTSTFESVLPNLANFYDMGNLVPADPSTFPVGYLKADSFA